MKKIVASVGLAALGASTLQTASGQGMVAPDTSKPWSIGATLRGFYDDNTGTLPNGSGVPAGYKRDSFGFEVSPSGTLVWSPQEQTTLNVGVMYSLLYYANKVPYTANHTDQTFTFNGGLTHAFNEQLKTRISDSFVIGQEPDLLRAGNTFATFQRVSGDNIRNYGAANLDAQITPKIGVGLGYDNALYDYKNKGISYNAALPFSPILPSTAGVLNRDENRVHLEGLYLLFPETKAILGYQFSDISYTGDELIGGYVPFGPTGPVFYPVYSDSRNLREHTIYVGAEHTFMPELTGSVRVGGSYTDYYNDSTTKANWTPYALASMRYTYSPDSYAEAGVSYDRTATDVVGFYSNGRFTQDAEAAVVYATINHRIAPMLYGSLMAQFQNDIYNGGAYNNVNDQYYLVGLDLEYRFNPYFSAHVGYNYDRLESNINNRGYDRNRVYIGVTASY